MKTGLFLLIIGALTFTLLPENIGFIKRLYLFGAIISTVMGAIVILIEAFIRKAK